MLYGRLSVVNRISRWLHENKLVPESVAPNHGFRHRFKTIAIELDLSLRVVDAIQGHASDRASDDYGDVSLSAKYREIKRLPDISLAVSANTN